MALRPFGDDESTHRLIFGCGYLGERVAKRWLEAGDHVSAVTRNENRPREWWQDDVRVWTIGADVTKPETLKGLRNNDGWLPGTKIAFDTVLFAVGYDRSAGPSIHEVYAEGFRNVLDALPVDTGRVIYISTTGVYGGAGGDWVDEQTPTDPQRDGGKASLAAEEALRASPFADRGVALRLAGIYGPSRVPFLDKLKAGELIPAPQEGNLNLIHVDDAADIVVAASNHDGPLPPMLCVSDGAPPQRADYYREVARRLGAPEPKFVDPPADSPRAARATSSKKVRNDLMKQTLGVSLRYPDYRSGLAAILDA